MVPRCFAHLLTCYLLMEPPVALPIVVMLNTDVMAFMQMQVWPSDDVVDLSFSAQKSHDSNRLTSEHLVLDEFNEFSRGIFCPPFLNTSFDCAFEKPGGCLTVSHRKVAAKGLQSGHDYNCLIRQLVCDIAGEFLYELNASATALSRSTRQCATLIVDIRALRCDSLTKFDFYATTRIQPAPIYYAGAHDAAAELRNDPHILFGYSFPAFRRCQDFRGGK